MRIEKALSVFAQAGAGWVLWVLLGLSFVAVAVALDRALCILSTRDDIGLLRREVMDLLEGGRDGDAIDRLRLSSSYEARVALAGLSSPRAGVAAAEERMAGASQRARLAMETRLSALATIGSNAPFVGLLGTVIGIVRAFRALEAAGGRATPHLLAEIGEALAATAVGLVVALPALAFYNLFQRTITTRLARADALGRDVLAHLKSVDHDGDPRGA